MSKIKLPSGKEIEEDEKTVFLFVAGRYYSQMYFISLPIELSKFGKGGNINGLLWRKNEEGSPWVFQFRFRQYKSEAIWESKDERTWWYGELKEKTEEECIAKCKEVMNAACQTATVFGAAPLKLHTLEIRGDFEAATQAFQRPEAFFLHTQSHFAE